MDTGCQIGAAWENGVLHARLMTPGIGGADLMSNRSADDLQGSVQQDPAAVDALMQEWAPCRAEVKDSSLDATFQSERWGEMSLRWVYLHMMGEYAQHTGHADLLRERIDGKSRW